MGVSQPLNLGDRLREALAEFQSALDSANLTAKVKLEATAGGGSASSVEASLDRVEKDAKDAAEKSIASTSSGTGPLSASDRLTEAMDRLIKAFQDADGGPSGGGLVSRRRGPKAPPSGPGEGEGEGGEGRPGWVNPYLLQGLIQNPLGTTQNSLMSMLMGGAGAGIKAPGWLTSMLAGTEGFSPGLALGAETGIVGTGAAGSYASAGMIGAAKVAVPVAAFAGMMKWQHSVAQDRMQDARAYLADIQFGRGFGIGDWREGTWGGNEFQSRKDIYSQGVQEVAQGASVGLGGYSRTRGAWGMASDLNEAVLSGMGLGVSSSQMGGLIGAAVRSGTLNLNGPDGQDQLLKYLGLIENWTRKGAEAGLSSQESLQRLAELSHMGMGGTNYLSKESLWSLASMNDRIRQGLPDELKRAGSATAMEALGADASGDTQRVLMMNQWLGSDGNLTQEGMNLANQVFHPSQVQAMQRRWGRMAGTQIAYALSMNPRARISARTGLYQQAQSQGLDSAASLLLMGTGNPLGDALGMDAALGPLLKPEERMPGLGDHQGFIAGSTAKTEEEQLNRLAGVIERLSGTTAASAIALVDLGQKAHYASRAFVEFADTLRMGGTVKVGGVNLDASDVVGLSNPGTLPVTLMKHLFRQGR